MKVLVTGGTGFIGNHVVRMCIDQGDQVRVMAMPGEDLASLAGLDVEVVEGNLTDDESLDRAVAGVEGLYHLAAIYKLWLPEPGLMYRVNVSGTRTLMLAAMRHKLQKIVYTSSIAAVGCPPGTEVGDEETPFDQWHSNDYILSKYISELEVRVLIGKGLPAVIVSPGFPFGPGDRAPTPTGNLILKVMANTIPVPPRGGICAVDVRDVARGHLQAMAKGRVGESYLLVNTEGNLTFLELAKMVREITGRRHRTDMTIPFDRLSWVGWMLEKLADLTGREPLLTRKAMESLGKYYFYDSAKAVRELGMPQTPPEKSLRDSIEWFKDNGYA